MPAVPDWVLPTLLPHAGGIAGALITRPQIDTWYASLKKPSWRPPNYYFGPVWTSLYTGMGYASYLAWRDGGGFEGDAKIPLMLYASQLTLNWAWTPIFFGAHKLGLAFGELALLTVNVGACTFAFWKINQHAGLLMLPYLAWVSFASFLAYRIWKDNAVEDKKESKKKS
ncbi:unnamed protein product [Darwinula stevensoni]|uniref:Translocator protein n=1 Tax=Darwinula stevensoni TaxID=69355 RepID=A0A7R9A1V7_9CRUS|nr:unnamed protein product [Darwinula stevensoni]CAG0884399.1 unnamed protein product [Darwinula stevensoni]